MPCYVQTRLEHDRDSNAPWLSTYGLGSLGEEGSSKYFASAGEA